LCYILLLIDFACLPALIHSLDNKSQAAGQHKSRIQPPSALLIEVFLLLAIRLMSIRVETGCV
jgi:hypothetical protein